MAGKPDVVIFTTLYKHTSDFIKAAQKAGFEAQMVSNSFPGASPLGKELGKQGAGVAIAQDVPPPTKRSVPVVKEYQEAIEDSDLSSPIREIVRRQYNEVKSAHDRIKQLRDMAKTS